jgi:hypothetical protein
MDENRLFPHYPRAYAGDSRSLSHSVSGQSGQTDVTEPNRVAFAFLGGINDAPGDNLINDCRLPRIVQTLTGGIKGVAKDASHSVVKIGPRSNER